MFIAFLKAYYEWLETNGTQVWTGKVLGTSATTVVLSDPAATTINAYSDMYLVCLNGPSKGQTQKIKTYDPSTKTVTLVNSWDQTNIPPPNTKMEIRDQSSPEKLLEYRDIDYTLDKFITYFRDEFMYLIPGNIVADERNILKGMKQFYQAKGTENSFRFLFRIMFNEEIEFYYPKVDVFRPSDARWYTQNIMRTTTTGDTFDYLNRQVIGVYSGATAKVESVSHQYIPEGVITNFTLSSIDGQFQIDPATGLPEQVKIVYPVAPPPQTDLGSVTDLQESYNQIRYESTYQLLNALAIETPGNDYQVGELITISGGGSLSPATAIISSIFQTYYNGSCSIPPSTYYLEPYFGPNDTVNPTEDFTKDGVCIPGMYYFSDVHSQYTDADLLNPNQIILSSNETTVDDFFVGDPISLVAGTGTGQQRKIVSYDGATKVATVDVAFTDIPDGTTQYSITHIRGGIKSTQIIDFGLGFVSTPTITIQSAKGSGASLPPALGIVGTTAGQWTPGRAGGIGGFPTTPDSFASSNKIIQDSYYWQDFSYDLRFSETVDKYRDAVKKLLHPAGLAMFGSVLLKSKPETNFLRLLRENILQLESKFFSFALDLKTNESDVSHTILELVSDDGLVLGTTNYTLDAKKFLVFPPDIIWSSVYPDPNALYWAFGLGNTQINHFKDRTIGSFVNFPNQRTNIAYDTDIQIEANHTTQLVGPIVLDTTDSQESPFILGTIPLIGNEVQYDFVEGVDPDTVYNTCPITLGEYDSINHDGTWVAKGLQLDRNFSQTVDASVVPIHLKQCTVILVAACDDVTVPQSILNCLQTINDNGFSIDVVNSSLWMRVQNSGVAKYVQFPSYSLDSGKYFMAVLRFDRGLLKGSISSSQSIGEIFANYPGAPVPTPGLGWHFGSATTDYVLSPRTASEFGTALFGTNMYSQIAISGSSVSTNQFSGTLAYAYFYDRSLYDYEVDSIFRYLQGELYGRGIELYETTIRSNKGKGRIQVTAPLKTMTGVVGWQTGGGGSIVSARTQQPVLGVLRLQQTRTSNQIGHGKIRANWIQLGLTRMSHVNISQTQLGLVRLQETRVQALSGAGRIYTTIIRQAFGLTKIRHTYDYVQLGLSRLQLTTPQILSGVTKMQNTTLYDQFGNFRIYGTTTAVQTGVTNIQATTIQPQIAVANIWNTTQQMQLGVMSITLAVTQQTQTGVSNIVLGRTQEPQTGVAQIYTPLTVPALTDWSTNTQEVTTGPVAEYYTLTPTDNTYEAYFATFGVISGSQPFRRFLFHTNYKPGTGIVGLSLIAQDGVDGSSEIVIDLTYNTIYSTSVDTHFATITAVGDGSYNVDWLVDLQGTVTIGYEFYPTTLSSHDGTFSTGANVQVMDWEVAIGSYGENQQFQTGVANIQATSEQDQLGISNIT